MQKLLLKPTSGSGPGLPHLLKRYFGKKALIAGLALAGWLSTSEAQAQLTGTKTIPGNYATIAAAVADLNTSGVGTGGVTFNIAAGHTETGFGIILTASGTSTDPIKFQKSGTGANPKITAGTGISTSLDGMILFSGADYVTFDGIDLEDPATNTTNTTRMEWGYALLKVSITNGSQNITIKNCTINLQNANTASKGIYTGNHTTASTTSLTATGMTADGLNSNNKFFNNTINGAYIGISLNGNSTASTYDLNNEIGVGGPNIITNFGGGSSTAYGVYAIYQDNLKIANNTLTSATGTTTTLYGILNNTATNGNAEIYNNTISITGGATTSSIYGINNGAGNTGTNNLIKIYGNTIQNSTYATATSGVFYAIYNGASAYDAEIYNNTIQGINKPGTGTFYGIYQVGNVVNNESIHHNSITDINSAGTGTFYLLYSNATSTTKSAIYNNHIRNISAGSSTIYAITSASTATSNIYYNNIYNLTSTAASGAVYGITYSSGTANVVYNNFISELKATASTGTDAVRGIAVTGGTATSIIYNTIYLNAVSSSATTFGSTGVYASTSPTLDLRNNIIVNVSTPGPTGGLTAAYRRSGASPLTSYASVSNTNLYYAGTPSANRVIFTDGTNNDQTLGAYKTRVSPRDGSSVTGIPPFLNVTTSPYNLHINPAIATQIEGTATPITTPIAITTDFDGNPRNATTPDMGADEGNFIPQDLTPPAIAYTPLSNTLQTTGDRTFNATISDASDVHITGAYIPRIYYRKNNGSYFTSQGTFVSGNASSSTWTFTIAGANVGPLTGGDVIYYYVIAQDMANPDNIGSIPSGVTASDVNTVTTHPANPYSYIIQTAYSGNVNVGTSEAITSLTNTGGLFDKLNVNALGGNLTINITSDLTSETGAIALNQLQETGAGNYTLTIQPSAAANRTISGSFAGGLIRLNGADRVIIDGSVGGTGRFLTISNTNSTASNTAAIQIMSQGTGLGAVNNTIRNTNIAGGSNTVTSAFGIYAGSTTISTSGTGAENNNLTIQNNVITNAYIAIYARGVASTGLLTNLKISNNTIGSNTAAEYVTFRGTDIMNATAPEISGNTIFNLKLSTSASISAIEIGQNCPDALISKNRIYGLYSTSSAGYGAYGIHISTGTGNSNITIVNNMISDLITSNYSATSTTYNPFGIRIAGGTNLKIYFNTIYMAGSPTTGTSASMSSPLVFTSNTVSGIDIRNNIFHNEMTGIGATKTYAIYAVSGTTFGTIDYNDYFAPITGYLGSEKATLATWQTATSQDANSKNVNADFVSATDLHASAFDINNSGIAITGITTDFDGDTRSATTPDIGADEFNLMPLDLSPVTLGSPVVKGCYGSAEQVSITVRNLGSSAIDFSTNQLTVSASVSGAATQTFTPAIINTNALNGGTPLAAGAVLNIPVGTLNMAATGTYTFNASITLTGDGKASNNTMNPVNRIAVPVVAGTARVSQPTFCLGGIPTFSVSGNAGGDIQWQVASAASGPFTNITGATGTSYTPAAAINQTAYYQAVSTCGLNSDTTNVLVVTVNNPQITSAPGVTICAPGSVTLTANAPTGTNVDWFSTATGGTALASGNSFSTTISGTTTYYAEASTGTVEKVGKMSTTGADGTNTGGGLIFNAATPFTLDSVVVYSAIAAGGNLTINLKDATGTVIQTTTFALPAVTSRTAIVVPLNFNVPAGTGLRLEQGSALALSRDYTAASGVSFPYSSPSQVVTITDGTLAGYYYFFFRWSISNQCFAATRVPVVATLNTPAATPTITAGGPTTFCAGSNVVLTAASTTAGATYEWSLNGTLLPGATAATYTANAAGNYTVVASSNGCASAASAATAVTVNPTPATPTISQSGNAGQNLTSSAASGNQWYLNGTAIPGATNQTYTTSANGNYTVMVTTNGCASLASAAVNITNTGISKTLAGMSVNVYPNPNNGIFNVKLTGYKQNASLELYSLTGQQIVKTSAKAGQEITPIQVNNLAAGTYLLKVVSDKGVQIHKMIVE